MRRFCSTAMVTAMLVVLFMPGTSVSAQSVCDGYPPDAGDGTTLRGGSGNQVLVGTDGPDVLNGGSGNDILCGFGGDDRLIGGSGNDVLDAGGGSNTLIGKSGNDTLIGMAGDRFNGGSGRDEEIRQQVLTRCEQAALALNYNPANFTVYDGDETNNNFIGTTGADLICGFGGNDYVEELSAGDVFIGGADRDGADMDGGTFHGGAGEDVAGMDGGKFYGDVGNDRVGTMDGGTFYGGVNDDLILTMYSGTFNGGDGYDSVIEHFSGDLIDVESS